MNVLPTLSTRQWLNKVPEVMLLFWIIKMMSTTVGETAADYLNVDLGFGLVETSVVMAILLVISLFFQISARRYIPALYWIAVVFVSVLGTLITDNLTDNWAIPLSVSSTVFSIGLIVTFALWYAREQTLSIHSINNLRRELFYWVVILFTFALGTALGDWIAEGLSLGYINAALLFGGLIAVTALAYYVFKVNSVLCFWIAYVLTRPFGAACGDLLSQPADHGGLGFGTTWVSALFLVTIVLLVVYLSLAQKAVSQE
ncbi:COG4705 family protein [Limnobaculum parvum]|uniref:Membrane-anchored protein n=1 Tax=Limnobaculum parvum TaxID=2172103 RepID=A0A2Y9TY01_9GAMM|nr:hypothetical protein [Limnobaculum parvum]AWH88613.1 hypothetical protein HYN51_08600 [Limnobaculum parvum]